MEAAVKIGRSSRAGTVLGIALLAILTACGPNQTVLRPVHLDSYDPQDLFYLANKGPVLTQVIGNPFPEDKTQVDGATTTAMTGATFFPKLSFATEVPPEQNSPYHVVMVLDALVNTRPEKLCADPRDDQNRGLVPNANEKLRIVAVYCANDRRLSSISGSAPRPASSSDPRFQNLIRQTTLNLFPPDNPDRRDRDEIRRVR